jgi:hypothetical protein
MAFKRYAAAACLWLILSGPSSAANNFTYLAPDRSALTATPNEAKLVGEIGPYMWQTNDSHFDIADSKGNLVAKDVTWFAFIGSNNGTYVARSTCSYDGEDVIRCYFTWHDIGQSSSDFTQNTVRQMPLFDGQGNCTVLIFDDIAGQSGIPQVNQLPNHNPDCTYPKKKSPGVKAAPRSHRTPDGR